MKLKKGFIFLNLGILMLAFGIFFFRNPNQFALGGVTGISLLLVKYLPNIPIGATMMALNVILLIVAYFTLGKSFAGKTVYGTVMLSAEIWLLEMLFQMPLPFTDQKLLELFFAVFIPGIGSALVFYSGATTGGMDIVAKLISKYSNANMGTSLLYANFLIGFSALFVYGVESCLYSVFGIVLSTVAVNAVLESLYVYKVITIVSDKNEMIKLFICNELKTSATTHSAFGAFTNQPKEVITTVLSRSQAFKLQQFVYLNDPDAFITITNSNKVIGKNFGDIE